MKKYFRDLLKIMPEMKYNILKWCIPVISYFVFVGLFYLWCEIDVWVFGHRFGQGGGPLPPLPDSFMFFLALPLIPWGYILLGIAQYLHKKKRKRFKKFAWAVTIVSIILRLIFDYIYYIDPSLPHFLWTSFPTILFYYVPFFLSLSYIFKRILKNAAVS
jgi:hypothetical protein